MTMTKNRTIQEVGLRTRLKNRDVQLMLETLIEVWTEELVAGGRVEVEHFIVIDVQTIERKTNRLLPARRFRQIAVRASKSLRTQLNDELNSQNSGYISSSSSSLKKS